jgi:hypothetical protein
MLSERSRPKQVGEVVPTVADLTSDRPCGSLTCPPRGRALPLMATRYPAGRRLSCPPLSLPAASRSPSPSSSQQTPVSSGMFPAPPQLSSWPLTPTAPTSRQNTTVAKKGNSTMTVGVSGQNSATIPVSCIPHRGTRGFATLMVERRGEEVVFDVQVTGGCTIILEDATAAALFDLLGAWLG